MNQNVSKFDRKDMFDYMRTSKNIKYVNTSSLQNSFSFTVDVSLAAASF